MDKLSEVEASLDRLHEFMRGTMSSHGTSRPHRLLWLIGRWLKQFNLDSQIDASEILVEAYLRTRSQILKGKPIKNFPAWLNSVSYKVIQEHSRKEKYRDLLTQRLIRSGQYCTEDDIHGNEFAGSNIRALLQALADLNAEELEILDLRIIQGFSWKEVRTHLRASGGKDISESTLRQKGARSLKHLRDAFAATSQKISLQVRG